MDKEVAAIFKCERCKSVLELRGHEVKENLEKMKEVAAGIDVGILDENKTIKQVWHDCFGNQRYGVAPMIGINIVDAE
jgi:sorbitol-specific phosphotransferase system component IIBC